MRQNQNLEEMGIQQLPSYQLPTKWTMTSMMKKAC
jgi:hypothetical protein